MQFGPAAEPLTPCREDLVFVRGLYNQLAFQNPSPHMGRMANMLSGAWVSTDQGEIRSLEAMEADMIRLALGRYRGHMTEVAKRLGIGRSTLYRKMREFGLEERLN